MKATDLMRVLKTLTKEELETEITIGSSFTCGEIVSISKNYGKTGLLDSIILNDEGS